MPDVCLMTQACDQIGPVKLTMHLREEREPIEGFQHSQLGTARTT